jgi:predicted glycosyltransferase
MAAQHLISPRLLFYAINGLGLGHVSRTLAIARAVRAQRPEAQILFLTTSEADHVIYREGFAAVKLPSTQLVGPARLRPAVFTKLTHTVVLNTVSAFNPAILVTDTFPAGVVQELLPTLSWEMRRAFVFRAQQLSRANEPFFQAALASYNLVITPHAPGSEEIPVPEKVPLVWSGPILIRGREEALTRRDARERLGLPRDGKVLYVAFGGGGDEEARAAAHTAIEAAEGRGWTIAVADAPLARTDSTHRGIYQVNHYPMAECFSAFDAAITAAGYNTVHELLHFGVPCVLVPFARKVDDQFARAAKLAAAGCALSACADTGSLREALLQLADPAQAERLSQCARAQVPENGAHRAAEAILALL